MSMIFQYFDTINKNVTIADKQESWILSLFAISLYFEP